MSIDLLGPGVQLAGEAEAHVSEGDQDVNAFSGATMSVRESPRFNIYPELSVTI